MLRRSWGFLLSCPSRVLMVLVQGYRLFLSPLLGTNCRFYPSCSAYALQALSQHGALGGVYLSSARLLRCHPFCSGGHDPVPAELPRIFSIWCSGAQRQGPSPKRDGS